MTQVFAHAATTARPRVVSPSRAARARAELSQRIAAAHVPRARADNLRLATWNIRELGKTPRLDASIGILARVIASFDLVSIVELRDNLGDLHRILATLGGPWRAVYSDYLFDHGGNRERVGFVYREDRVRFTGLASSAETARRARGRRLVQTIPWWRPPFLASFDARGFAFLLVAAHLRWGERVADREMELAEVGTWLAGRRREAAFGGENVLVVGDFNIASDRSSVWPRLAEAGLVQAPGLDGELGSNLSRGKRYDRILCTADDVGRLTGRAGVVDWFVGGWEGILPGAGVSETRMTWEVSDHLPVWAEVGVGV